MSAQLLSQILGENIVAQRKRLGLSQKELAFKLKISYESLGKIERGVMSPKISRFEDFAKYLQCSVAFLFEYKTSDVIQNNAKVVAELLNSLPPNGQEAFMAIMYATANALMKKE